MSREPISGIHHVTAIAKDPRENLDFYTGVLGLRLVKKTVNFDEPSTYHFYFGDSLGHPGTILTFFPWPNAGRGRPGHGQTVATAFSVPPESLGYWEKRLAGQGVETERGERFGEELLAFSDPHDMSLELVASGRDSGFQPWEKGGVPGRHAIRSFHSVTLCERDDELTAGLLERMGFSLQSEAQGRSRFAASSGEPASRVDILHQPDAPRSRIGRGSVHHVAWRVPDRSAQESWREYLLEKGYNVTEILDRNYFESIYFREAGGVLFEFATDRPGFTADEPAEELGRSLKLPPWLENARSRIENALPSVRPVG